MATLVARTSVARKRPSTTMALGSGRKPYVLERRLTLRREQCLDPCLSSRLLRRLRHDSDLVAHARLRPRRDPDDGDLVAHGARVRDVHEAGVRLPECDLARDGADVGLLAHDLGRARR